MNNPYKFNEPIHIAFSGGRSSAFMLKKIIDAGLPNGSQVVFCNTGKEMEETLEFVRDCSINWNVPIVWLEYDLDAENKPTHKIVSYETASRHGEPFERMILRKLYLPNAVTRICTIELKIKTAHSYCLSIGMDISSDEAIMGFRYDEPRRAAKLLDKSRAPMYLAKHTVSDVLEFWEKSNFDLKLQSINGQTKEGNCDLCFMKGLHQIYSIIAKTPTKAIWWAKAETMVFSDGRPVHFSSKRPSYQSMLDNVKNQDDWIGHEDDESISCFCGD